MTISAIALWAGYAILTLGAGALLLGALIGLALLGNRTQHVIKDHFGGWSALREFIAWRQTRIEPSPAYQERVRAWAVACFGEVIPDDVRERSHRFVEEALELAQASGCTEAEARQLVSYVFNRPKGELAQEAGAAALTLAALCSALKLNMDAVAEAELARVWTRASAIRAKQASKPKDSPLPQHVQLVTPEASAPANIQCWACRREMTFAERSENDGFCPHCSAEIEPNPLQKEP